MIWHMLFNISVYTCQVYGRNHLDIIQRFGMMSFFLRSVADKQICLARTRIAPEADALVAGCPDLWGRVCSFSGPVTSNWCDRSVGRPRPYIPKLLMAP